MPRRFALLAAALLLAACGGGDAQPPAVEAPAPPAESAAPAPGDSAAALTDAQVVDILAAASEVDRRAGELARDSGADPRAKQLGAVLAADHAGAGQAVAELAARLGIVAEANPTSARFHSDGERNRAILQRETGPEFDRVFLENEIEYHTMMLQALDGTLLPAIRNAELRRHVQQIRPVVESHLEQARQLQSALAAA
jgi:putative membrane protein